MANTFGRGYEALRRGRHSYPGAEYFLTICTQDRKCGLARPLPRQSILEHALQLEEQQYWHLRTGTVMPDHVHFLITLGQQAELSAVIRKFKGPLASALRFASLHWQRGYFERRLRDNEDRPWVFFYIYLNPNRAGLISPGDHWPGYYCSPKDWVWFGPMISSIDSPTSIG